MTLFICHLVLWMLSHYNLICITQKILDDQVSKFHLACLQVLLDYEVLFILHRYLTARLGPFIVKHWTMAWWSLVHLFTLNMSMMMAQHIISILPPLVQHLIYQMMSLT